ncbi:MAG: hypothetical protein Q7V00_01425 [Sulfurimicrobium sp.]|nr:hypothetical protein [Sulfurimicrobium sp.]MDP2199097.1 hypothetical protein [Sulfurimicrobium sp.]MDP3686676.1 hypothetical protein [Sulfurimicrobium sp.]
MKASNFKVIVEARLVAEGQLGFFREMRAAKIPKVNEQKAKQHKTGKRAAEGVPVPTA